MIIMVAEQLELPPADADAAEDAAIARVEQQIEGLTIEQLRCLSQAHHRGKSPHRGIALIDRALAAALSAHPDRGEDAPNQHGVYVLADEALNLDEFYVEMSISTAHTRWGLVPGFAVKFPRVYETESLSYARPADITGRAYATKTAAIVAALRDIETHLTGLAPTHHQDAGIKDIAAAVALALENRMLIEAGLPPLFGWAKPAPAKRKVAPKSKPSRAAPHPPAAGRRKAKGGNAAAAAHG